MQILLKTRLFWNRVGKWSPNCNSQKHVCSEEYKFTGSLVTLSPSIWNTKNWPTQSCLAVPGSNIMILTVTRIRDLKSYLKSHWFLPHEGISHFFSSAKHMRAQCQINIVHSTYIITVSWMQTWRIYGNMIFDISQKTQTKIPLFQLSSTLDTLRKETGHDISQL
jgi:hypothetical protein